VASKIPASIHCGGDLEGLVDFGVSAGLRGFGGTVLNRTVNRAVHSAVNSFSESIQ
jgi:hypothetical protein